MNIKLGLLVCDTPAPPVLSTHGPYPQIFSALLKSSLPSSSSSVDWTLDPFDVANKMEYPAEEVLDQYAGFIMTGSAASAYEDKEWITKLVNWTSGLIREKPKIKLIGICFGHQIVGRAMGGECVSNNGKWEIGSMPINLNEVGHKIFGQDAISIHQMHRDHIPTVPPPLKLIGSTEVCMNQGMVKYYSDKAEDQTLANIHVLTVQGHPEFTNDIVKKIVTLRAGSGAIDADTAQEYQTRQDNEHDGAGLIGSTIWKVLLS